MSKFVAIAALVAAVILGFFWHRHRVQTAALNSGEVYVRDQPSGPASPLPTPATVSQAGDQIAATATPKPDTPSIPTPQISVAATAKTSASILPASANSDSIPRNPPNGLTFAGNGKFQLYRQGDITWRLDTQTGDTCVLFATDAQWRVPRVYQAGCGTRSMTTLTSGD